MKLKNKMLFSIGIPVLLVMMLLSVISYIYSNKLLIQETRESMKYESEKYGSDIETLISEKAAYVEISAGNLSRDKKSDKSIKEEMVYLTKNVKGTLGFLLGLKDKRFIYGGDGEIPNGFDPTTRPWYKEAIGKNNIVISKPYTDAITGKMVITISKNINYENEDVGVLASDILISDVEQLVKSIVVEKTGKGYLLDGDGNFIIHEKYGFGDNLTTVENGEMKELMSKIYSKDGDFFENKTLGVKKIYSTYPIKNTNWKLVLFAPKKEVVQASNKLGIFMLIIGSVAVLAILIIIYFISSSVTTPIIKLTSCIENMVNYDFSISDNSATTVYSKNKDEIGIIARSLIKVNETVRDIIMKIQDTANQVSGSSQELTATSEHSAQLAHEVESAVQVIEKGALIQAQDMQKSAEAIKVMQKAITENDNIIEKLNETTKQVSKAKENGISTINELIEATEKSKNAAMQITQVITNTNDRAMQIESASDMIKSIADQTNLLALNAAIESARAGEAGRGFAVVAEEIRKLAEQSNTFTQEIKEIVLELTAKTSQAVEIMGTVGEIVLNQTKKVDETKEQFDLIAKELEKNGEEIDKLNLSGRQLESIKHDLSDIIENLTKLSKENVESAQHSSQSVQEQTQYSKEVALLSANLSEMAQEMIDMISKFNI